MTTSDSEENLLAAQLTKETILASQLNERADLDLEPEAAEESLVRKEDPGIRNHPWLKLAPLYYLQVSDAISGQIIEPFVGHMVGVAAGLLIGAASIGGFCSGVHLGYFSDRYGRRKLILFGCFSSLVSALMFGLAPNYWVALLSRFLLGLGNANIALSKACVSDLTTGPTRALAFAYLGGFFAIARAIASALGGLTSGILIPLPYLEDNPYAVPSFIGAFVNLVAIIVLAINLPETNSNPDAIRPSILKGLRVIYETPPLWKSFVAFALNSLCNGWVIIAFIAFTSLDISKYGLELSTRQTGVAFFVWGIFCCIYQFGAVAHILKRYKLRGSYRLGTRSLALGSILMPLSGFFYHFWPESSEDGSAGASRGLTVALWSFLSVATVIFSMGWMTALPVLNTIVSNASPAESQGLTQGACRSLGSFSRGMGPILGGALFTLYGGNLGLPIISTSVCSRSVFALISTLYIFCERMSTCFEASVEVSRTALPKSTKLEKLRDV